MSQKPDNPKNTYDADFTPVLAFDIETVPDTAGIRALYALPENLGDEEAAAFFMQKRRAEKGSDFMPPHLHKVVAVSCCLRWKKDGQDRIHISTIGTENDGEDVLIAGFFRLIDRYTPQLVSWNGGGFDLPVLHYRALRHGITAKMYWRIDEDKEFKWNNYTGRYHWRHCDLMDVLAMFQPRNNVPLDEMAKLCGFPGKLGMDGSKVWEAYCAGKIREIRDYCETDAFNTYLMFQRFQLMRGRLCAENYAAEIAFARDYIANPQNQEKEHWRAFQAAWQ